MANGQWLKVKKICGAFWTPHNLLIYEFIALRAEAWEGGACATADDWFADIVTTLGYNLENIHFRSSIAQNISFHNAFEI